MLENLKEITKVQCADGNWNHDEYMRGLANGMILSVAVLEGRDPVFLEKPVEDGCGDATIADNVLKNALGIFEDILLLGHYKDGTIEARSNLKMTHKDILWVIEQFKLKLVRGDFAS